MANITTEALVQRLKETIEIEANALQKAILKVQQIDDFHKPH